MRFMAPSILLALAIGCGDPGGAEESSGPASTSGASGSSGEEVGSSGGPASGSSGDTSVDTTGGDMGLSHGFVQLALLRGESQADDPYVGTATVIAVLQYAECLTAFYDANPALRQEGAEGELIFGGSELGGEGWLDRLCSPAIAGHIDCEVQAIVQDLAIAKQLTVVYTVTGALEGGRLLFGPLPTTTTAMCEGGLDARVRVGSTNAVTGNADNGTQLWGTESFSPSEAVTNQGAPIEIRAAPVGG